MDCNASGDQPLQIDWFRESPGSPTNSNNNNIYNQSSNSLDKRGNDFYDIHEQITDFGLSSHMQIRQLKGDDSLLLYKCLARNEYGSSERLIKLIALGVPRPPSELRVRDVWSRSALISWQPPSQQQQSISKSQGELMGRISNYTVQYWRKNPASSSSQHQTLASKQNHRRDDLLVDGLHNSALLVNLLPAITYEVSVIAHNQVGRSEPSEPINVTTSEEEPSAPPTDVQLEPRGSSTLRVMWKVPPSETLNGRLLGFYVGYRPRFFLQNSASALLQVGANQPVSGGVGGQNQQQQLLQSVIYSFKTADAFEGQIFYETFLGNLKHNQEYEITVRAFNKAGSGPDCHVITARTSSAKLPQAPNLQVQKVTTNSVTLRWTATVFSAPASRTSGHQQLSMMAAAASGSGANLPSEMVIRYVLYYQILGERDWYELTVGRPASTVGQQQDSSQEQLQQAPDSGQPQSAEQLATGELVSSQASVHILSNLQPDYIYRVYVAAANDYGIGDPSNVVTLRTVDSLPHNNGSTNNLPAFLGSAVLDDSLAGSTGSGGGGFFEQWGRQQQQWGFLYTTLTFGALIALLIILAAYLIWQHRVRNKYNNSSSASSYPSSWMPAASDTIQSEYSVKRFPPQPLLASAANNPPAAPNRSDNPSDLFGQPEHLTGRFSTTNARQQLPRSSGSSVARPMPQLTSHYHQPADLLISNSSTLQLHSGAAFRHQKASATLNRNQNRQLPPIPYTTMSVKETDSGGPNKQWRLQQQQQQQQDGYRQSLLRPNKQQSQPNQKQMASSQTPLIYGVIE